MTISFGKVIKLTSVVFFLVILCNSTCNYKQFCSVMFVNSTGMVISGLIHLSGAIKSEFQWIFEFPCCGGMGTCTIDSSSNKKDIIFFVVCQTMAVPWFREFRSFSQMSKFKINQNCKICLQIFDARCKC